MKMKRQPEPRWTSQTWLWTLVLVAAVLLAYQPTWRAGFIWDDDDHLTANPAMTTPRGLQMIWSSLAVSRYYPLTLTTFWVEHRVWGLHPAPYHVVNVLLHGLNGLLFFLVLQRLQVKGAWLAASLWTLHPVHVESVAWITELKNTQSALFFLGSVLCFLQFEGSRRPRWYGWSLLCAVCAVLSKPSTVVLPLVLLLCIWWQRRKVRGKDLALTGPFFVISLMMSAVAVVEQHRQIAAQAGESWRLSGVERFLLAGTNVWFYAIKLLWQVRLSFVYPRWNLPANSIGSWIPIDRDDRRRSCLVDLQKTILVAARPVRPRRFRDRSAAGARSGRRVLFPVLVCRGSLSVPRRSGPSPARLGRPLTPPGPEDRRFSNQSPKSCLWCCWGHCRPDLETGACVPERRNPVARNPGKKSRRMDGAQ